MRILSIFFAICAILCAATVHAAEMPSLFFTPAEIQKIEAPGAAPAQDLADIHLGAVLYYRADNWSVWLDGERWTPATRRADLQIIEVKPEQVKLQLINGPAPPIVLHPHQTWQAKTGKIVEGDVK